MTDTVVVPLKEQFKNTFQEENRVSAECFHATKKGTALAVPFSMIPG